MFFIKGLLDLEDPLVLLLKQITNGFPRKFSSLPQVFPQTILVQLLSSQNFLEIHSILQNILKVEKRSLIHFKFLYFHRVTLHWKNLKLINIQKNQFYGTGNSNQQKVPQYHFRHEFQHLHQICHQNCYVKIKSPSPPPWLSINGGMIKP